MCRTSWINTCHNIAEILLKLALNTNQAINHGKTEKFKVLNLIFRYLKLTLTNNIGKFFSSSFFLLLTWHFQLYWVQATCVYTKNLSLVFTSELIEVWLALYVHCIFNNRIAIKLPYVYIYCDVFFRLEREITSWVWLLKLLAWILILDEILTFKQNYYLTMRLIDSFCLVLLTYFLTHLSWHMKSLLI